MHVGVIGVNHKQADVTLRELVALVFHEKRIDAACVVLATCNRIELYFSAHNLAEVHQKILFLLKREIPFEFEQKLYTFFGIDCFVHLAKVVAGLDSAIVGETEIKGQVSAAYSAAHAAHRVNKELHYLFQKSLRISKKVRAEIASYRHVPGLEALIYARAVQFFHDALPPLLFVGASAVNLKIARYFAHKIEPSRMTFCTRTESNAKRAAEKMGVSWTPWGELARAAAQHAWVIAAAKSPAYLLSRDIAQGTKKLLIDLAVPRNIDPELSSVPNTLLLNIDSFCAGAPLHIFEAEEHLESEVERCFARYEEANKIFV